MLDAAARDSVGIVPEQQRVEAWRLHVLIEAGYPVELAEQLAYRAVGPTAIDVHRAVELVERGCAPAIAAEILL